MANKFQKSVLERLEQEAVRQKQQTKIKTTEITEDIKTNSIIENEPEPLAEVLEIPPKISKPESELQTLPDIGEYLRWNNQRLAKNKTFYLDNDVIESIKNTAKKQQVTDSKLVNDILRHVLGI